MDKSFRNIVTPSNIKAPSRYTIYREGTFVGSLAEEMRKELVLMGHSCYLSNIPKFLTGGKVHDLIKTIIVLDNSSGNFHVIEARDKGHISKELNELLRSQQCRTVLKCQYQKNLYKDKRVIPYTYFEASPISFQKKLEELRSTERSKDIIHFRGAVFKDRIMIVKELCRANVIPRDCASRKNKPDYIKECASCKIGLSLPGYGNLCHREIEFFGMGVPVVMPKLINSTHDPLVPNHHYISVRNFKEAKPIEIIQDILLVYQKKMQDTAFLGEISRNAMAWYDKNVKFPSSAKLAINLMGIT